MKHALPVLKYSLLSKEAKNNNSLTLFFCHIFGQHSCQISAKKDENLAVNELETCASFDEIVVLRNKAKCTLGSFSGVGRLDLRMCEK